MTMLTGLDVCAHGVPDLRPKAERQATLPAVSGYTRAALLEDVFAAAGTLRPDVLSLAEILRARGYATAAFTEDAFLTAGSGFARGFATFVENKSPDTAQPTGFAAETFGQATRWIDAHAAEPWFVFVHTYQVHQPYNPPPGYEGWVAPTHGADRAAADAARYDGEIRYTDELLDRFLGDTRAARPLVIVTSDYGEQFGERGLWGHANSLQNVLLRVPLILYRPGLVPSGRRITQPVGLIDLVPTMLDLLDVPVPSKVQGRSLVPLLHGDPLPDADLFALFPSKQQLAVLRQGRKWVIDLKTRRAECFELGLRGGEDSRVPLPSEPTVEALLARYEPRCTAARSGAPAPEPLDPAVREKLRALGYAD